MLVFRIDYDRIRFGRLRFELMEFEFVAMDVDNAYRCPGDQGPFGSTNHNRYFMLLGHCAGIPSRQVSLGESWDRRSVDASWAVPNIETNPKLRSATGFRVPSAIGLDSTSNRVLTVPSALSTQKKALDQNWRPVAVWAAAGYDQHDGSQYCYRALCNKMLREVDARMLPRGAVDAA